jgi:hypothetical protein
VEQLRVEQEDAGRPDEYVIVVSMVVLEVMLAMPLGAQPLDLFRGVTLADRALPPAEGRNVTTEHVNDQQHAEAEPGCRCQDARRDSADVGGVDRASDERCQRDEPEVPVFADVLAAEPLELARCRLTRSGESSFA